MNKMMLVQCEQAGRRSVKIIEPKPVDRPPQHQPSEMSIIFFYFMRKLRASRYELEFSYSKPCGNPMRPHEVAAPPSTDQHKSNDLGRGDFTQPP
ncbi:hypothetical protein AVEN_53202-1 [Araneus ventricosus]|uniref:Uncharacterized protein n=1 Tax=Araneus ventricosus TaxID=182803 RepID=A0A4Y2AA45_ARAVE|nr:hypothetical protein AVEN_53202-1 [Araneus ventricosus]